MKRTNGFFMRRPEKSRRVGVFATAVGVACLALMFGVRWKAAAEEHASPQAAEVVELKLNGEVEPILATHMEEGLANAAQRHAWRWC